MTCRMIDQRNFSQNSANASVALPICGPFSALDKLPSCTEHFQTLQKKSEKFTVNIAQILNIPVS